MYRLLVLCLALLTSFLTTLDAQVLPNGIVSDFEGNIYKTVTIGGQEEMERIYMVFLLFPEVSDAGKAGFPLPEVAGSGGVVLNMERQGLGFAA